MSLDGIETGAFDQGGDYTNTKIDPATGLPMDLSVESEADSAFTESSCFARDTETISSFWTFPCVFSVFGQQYDVFCEKIFNYDPGSGNYVLTTSPYRQGTYCAIYFNNQPKQTAPGVYQTVTNPTGVSVWPDGQLVYTFPAGTNWTFVSYEDYYGAPYGGDFEGNVPVLAIAPWGRNAVTIRQSSPMVAGTYNGVLGFPSSYIYFDNSTPPNVINLNNAIGGTIAFQIVAADFSNTVDVTPPGCGASNNNQGAWDGEGNDVPAVTRFSINTIALLGKGIAFYPQIVIGNVPDPGIAGSPYGGYNPQCKYGGQWQLDGH